MIRSFRITKNRLSNSPRIKSGTIRMKMFIPLGPDGQDFVVRGKPPQRKHDRGQDGDRDGIGQEIGDQERNSLATLKKFTPLVIISSIS